MVRDQRTALHMVLNQFHYKILFIKEDLQLVLRK